MAEFGAATFAAFDEKPKKTRKKRAKNQNDAPRTERPTGGSSKPATETFDFKTFEQKVIPVQIEGCNAETCYPPGWDFNNTTHMDEEEKAPSKPAREYPFTLDPFQRQSTQSLEKNQSVLVAAHTSAGKTVVAEYAIAMALRDQQRVVYTSPIKALSNQKYRELHEEFKDVGLMTGDITINPSASCLVMTTEILRNMLYRGSEVMREIAWVIFDEIHYMRDKSRGVVWEETLIMLPDKVRFVFLSATIPNAREFACWIAKLHNQPCNVVYTDFRPTPLQHYVFPVGGKGLYCVLDEKGVFREKNFQKALAVLNQRDNDIAEGGDGGRGTKKAKKRKKSSSAKTGMDIAKIVRMIMERKYHPVIVFSFSKRECETYAMSLLKLDFTTDEEKKTIAEVFNNAIDSLSEADKTLPQIHRMVPLLKRGIGIHHGGLLPILKELIEILFQEGLLKALFATETFAMGLNMPAKTVVFTNIRKFDGTDHRLVTGGEYIQMSGRAGRRGLDKRGIVIMMMDEGIDPIKAKDMIKGHSDSLNSSFHLGYNMVLNLMRVEGVDPETLMRKSFWQFQQTMSIPRLQGAITRLEDEKKSFKIPDLKVISEYIHLKQQLGKASSEMRSHLTNPINALPFLNPGRLVQVEHDGKDWGWGILVNYRKKSLPASAKKEISVRGSADMYILDVLLACRTSGAKRKHGELVEAPMPARPGQKGEMIVIPLELRCILKLSAVRVYVPKDIRSSENRETLGKSLREVHKRFPDGVPILDPVEDQKIKDKDFLKVVRRIELIESRLKKHKATKLKDLDVQCEVYEKYTKLDSEIKKKKLDLSNCLEDANLKQTLKGMTRVLRRLGHATGDNVVALKGRVACEISSCDELVVAEIILSNMLNDLTPEQVVALMSCLVFRERTEDHVKLKEDLQAPLRKMQDCVRKVADAIEDARLPIDKQEFVDQFKPSLMDIVYAWVRGANFADICKLTDIFEGTIIRCIRRLEELLRQMSMAAKLIGNTELDEKFQEGIKKLKRDIIFAASLYL